MDCFCTFSCIWGQPAANPCNFIHLRWEIFKLSLYCFCTFSLRSACVSFRRQCSLCSFRPEDFMVTIVSLPLRFSLIQNAKMTFRFRVSAILHWNERFVAVEIADCCRASSAELPKLWTISKTCVDLSCKICFAAVSVVKSGSLVFRIRNDTASVPRLPVYRRVGTNPTIMHRRGCLWVEFVTELLQHFFMESFHFPPTLF